MELWREPIGVAKQQVRAENEVKRPGGERQVRELCGDVAAGVVFVVAGEALPGLAAGAVVVIGTGELGPPILLWMGAHVGVAAVGFSLSQASQMDGGQAAPVEGINSARVPASSVDFRGRTRRSSRTIQNHSPQVGVGEREHRTVLGQPTM
ncbi:hypothetical protein NGTWS0302_32950 [Mycolicibacterium cyprinidarum]|uniref:Uncharacterized protein n=1 Tax=Mycolicibacterium cyprinidarum TaxID=2860311 RepID=A0ABQ4V484_9MYCO|nr:hypothetical protein NGTWS1702_31890 [Mycolicibacterium sp. NGTWSNA01]GJF13095.1 hypothetical protein NGTWS0302_32950 [Mycolicibacterium sp. NGTWS0302]